MSNIKYHRFDLVKPEQLLAIVNEDSIRTHLMDHPYFDHDSLHLWINDKIETDKYEGCRVRVVTIDGIVAGWCGIQLDDNGYELAIVISQRYWGCGIAIFKTLMAWAKELGHGEVLFHLLDTRPEYKALQKIATRVEKTELEGHTFTTYFIPVS